MREANERAQIEDSPDVDAPNVSDRDIIPLPVKWHGGGLIPADHPDRGGALERLNWLDRRKRELKEEIALFKEALELDEKERKEFFKQSSRWQNFKRWYYKDGPLRPSEPEVPTLEEDSISEIKWALSKSEDELEVVNSEKEELTRVLFDEETLKELRDLEKKVIGSQNTYETAKAQIPDPESLQKSNQKFLQDTFTKWYDKVTSKEQSRLPVIMRPEDQDWESLKNDTDVSKSGEYTLNPDTQGLDFEKAKIFIPDLSAWNGKPLYEVAEHLISTYSAQYHIPGIEYWMWLIENPDKSPQSLKDGKYHFFFGSVLRNRDGSWSVPYAYWGGDDWTRRARWVDSAWYGRYRVVLLEK